jgi:transcriptional regulator with XRE-family HTH domain
MRQHETQHRVKSMLARPAKAQDGTNRSATAPEAGRDSQKSGIALDQSAGRLLGTAIGVQIRTLRRGLDMTAGELAERAGVSGSMLSKIERGLASPSIATLAALASALKIPVARFFTSYDERRDCSLVRAGKGVMVERRGSKCGHQYELLGHSLSGELFVEPYLVTLTEEATPYPSFQHTGIEFLYVLSGEMRYRYADRVYDLRPGDALLFDATALHGPEALQRRPVLYLSVDFNLRA